MKGLAQFNLKMYNSEVENDSGYGNSPHNSDSESEAGNCKYVKSNGNFEDISSCLNKLLEANQEIITTAQFMENKNEPNQEWLDEIEEKATRSKQYSLVLQKLVNNEDQRNKLNKENFNKKLNNLQVEIINKDKLIAELKRKIEDVEKDLQKTIKEENESFKSGTEGLKKINNDLIITVKEMERTLKYVNSNNDDLLNKFQVAEREIKTLIFENEKLQRLNRNFQNQNQSEKDYQQIIHRYPQIKVFKRKVAENKARTQKFIIHLKRENAEIIEKLKQNLYNKNKTTEKQETEIIKLKNDLEKYQDDLQYYKNKLIYLEEEKKFENSQHRNLELEIKNLKRSPEDKTFPRGILKNTPKEDGILFSRHAPTKKFGQQNYRPTGSKIYPAAYPDEYGRYDIYNIRKDSPNDYKEDNQNFSRRTQRVKHPDSEGESDESLDENSYSGYLANLNSKKKERNEETLSERRKMQRIPYPPGGTPPILIDCLYGVDGY